MRVVPAAYPAAATPLALDVHDRSAAYSVVVLPALGMRADAEAIAAPACSVKIRD